MGFPVVVHVVALHTHWFASASKVQVGVGGTAMSLQVSQLVKQFPELVRLLMFLTAIIRVRYVLRLVYNLT